MDTSERDQQRTMGNDGVRNWPAYRICNRRRLSGSVGADVLVPGDCGPRCVSQSFIDWMCEPVSSDAPVPNTNPDLCPPCKLSLHGAFQGTYPNATNANLAANCAESDRAPFHTVSMLPLAASADRKCRLGYGSAHPFSAYTLHGLLSSSWCVHNKNVGAEVKFVLRSVAHVQGCGHVCSAYASEAAVTKDVRTAGDCYVSCTPFRILLVKASGSCSAGLQSPDSCDCPVADSVCTKVDQRSAPRHRHECHVLCSDWYVGGQIEGSLMHSICR